LYEYLLGQPLEKLDVDECCRRWPSQTANENTIRRLFGEGELRAVALQESRAKAIEGKPVRERLEKLRETWPSLRESLREQLLPFATLKSKLQTAGAPVEPEHIGISRQRLRDSFWQAYFIRRRFTVLDLAVGAGLLDSSLDQIFGGGGQWSILLTNAPAHLKK
jgi:glycerol-1-phosphate dehydrogenase [NAD(P)+]